MTSWKDLKRHPLSAEYRDITGPAWLRFTLKMKKMRYLSRYPIILHEGMVLDGWQRLRACIELNIEPDFDVFPEGSDARDYVEAVNDERRHETADEKAQRVAARRERVAEARQEGQSLRVIAKEEGVGVSTVVDDLEKPVVRPRTTDAKNIEEMPKTPPKVTGTDGKTYSATKHPKPMCPRCQRCERVGQAVQKNCEMCKELREPAKKPEANGKAEPKPKSGKPRFDEKKFNAAFGSLTRVIDERGNLMGKGENHKRCQDILGEFMTAYKLWMKETA